MTKPVDRQKTEWTLRDQVAFECALVYDEREEWETLKNRDRAIAELAPSDANAKTIARFWLDQRLLQTPALKQSAESVLESISLAGQALCVAGGLMGFSLAFAALAYTGNAPINVSAFFGVFILLQAFLALLLLLPFLLPSKVKDRFIGWSFFGFARAAFAQILKRFQSLAGRYMEAQQRSDIAEVAGIARARLGLHRSLFRWLAFCKLQSASLCFNLGALTALLLAVAFSDRAFGWQTTLDVSGESVHQLTTILALPWSWFYGEGQGYPTLQDIEGSRIVLKEGIRSLNSENLTAWWRFLALGILFYGILPRFALRILGGFQQRRVTNSYDFSNAAAVRLLDRISQKTQLFESEIVQPATRAIDHERPVTAGTPVVLQTSVRCLVASELRETLDLDQLRDRLARRWNLPQSQVDFLFYDAGAIDQLGELIDPKNQHAFVVESWMPPIKETERQIRTLRSMLGERSLIRIVPVGIPDPNGDSASLQSMDPYGTVWASFVRSFGDPYLMLEENSQ